MDGPKVSRLLSYRQREAFGLQSCAVRQARDLYLSAAGPIDPFKPRRGCCPIRKGFGTNHDVRPPRYRRINTQKDHLSVPWPSRPSISSGNLSFTMGTMKAVVIHEAGGPEVLKLETIPIPTPQDDEVLIRVKAFGLNRSELFTRQGYSPAVKFPRVLGIEAVGIVDKCPGGQFKPGQKVATCMGGMGRAFNGGYAEYTCVKASNVQALDSDLDWTVLGAAPEMLQTAYGSLFKALRLKSDDRLLIRGGTTSVGLAAAAIAKNHGCFVAATTRNSGAPTAEIMHKNGVDQVIVDDGNVAEQVKEHKFDKVLELVGTVTLEDSLRCAAGYGIVCMAGIVGKSECPQSSLPSLADRWQGNKWTLDNFSPTESIPITVYLTVYGGGPEEFKETPLNELLKQIEAGTLHIQVGKVFHLDEIVKAHDTMEKNLARGKIVVLTE